MSLSSGNRTPLPTVEETDRDTVQVCAQNQWYIAMEIFNFISAMVNLCECIVPREGALLSVCCGNFVKEVLCCLCVHLCVCVCVCPSVHYGGKRVNLVQVKFYRHYVFFLSQQYHCSPLSAPC